MGYDTIIYQPGPVARVILNRPERRNAQSWKLLAEMDHAFNAAMADPEARIILLSGNGTSFSAGHDLDSPEHVADRDAAMAGLDPFSASERTRDVYIDSHLRWRNLMKPTMAMVHGYCIFGGWMIASAMDFIFASDDALFIPVYGDYFTTSWDVGPRKAKEILFGNKFISAQEALQFGFVNQVHAAADLERETLKYASRVADGDPFLHRTIKHAINQTLDGMGFSQSVMAAATTFNNARPSRSDDAPRRTGQRELVFRNQVGRALEYLREDRAEAGGSGS